MCFPLKITKWWCNISYRMKDRILWLKNTQSIKSFLTFDGCAQYLTSPSAPYLISEAYREAGELPPVLVACVRDTKEQALSWWTYENNAIAWGESMGLYQTNVKLRGKAYPPKSFDDALKFGRSSEISNLYRQAERLFQPACLKEATAMNQRCILPDWAMSWPGGQLAGIGRNSEYTVNISRYEKVMTKLVYNYCLENEMESSGKVNILPLPNLSKSSLLQGFLVDVINQAITRKHEKEKHYYLEAFKKSRSTEVRMKNVKRNSNPIAAAIPPIEIIYDSHRRYFQDKTEELRQFFVERGITW
eukprot:CAMPEP_0176479070 /NCGR_PEP_ID=MMETSP0200_2-20121128/1540_1 /TAXON_ID=947934 /ORGANISM="Chaetoceros sp., Strain GSL56" /LENGTH=302 /DNA_ID=CAMNT_0017875083 /DNA_START=587 /DNA_END=1492 /DNA_ORIENTATION=-